MFKRSVIAMACIFALSACGGGGGGSPDVKSADTPSKPAAPVVAEKETEAKEDEPQAGSQGQGAPSAQGSQDMAAVSAENTGNGGAATTDKPKNEDEGPQNDMPQNSADTDSLTPNHTPAPNMPTVDMENQAPDSGESVQPANQPDMANAADGMQGTIRRQAGKMPAIRLPKVQIKPETIKPPVLQIPSPRQTLPLRIAAAILEGRTWLMASNLTGRRKI